MPTHTTHTYTVQRPRLYNEEELPCQTKGCKCRARWKLHCWHGNHQMICTARFDVWHVDGGFWVREREREVKKTGLIQRSSCVSALYLPGCCFIVVLFSFSLREGYVIQSSDAHRSKPLPSVSSDATGAHNAASGSAQTPVQLCAQFVCSYVQVWVHVCCCLLLQMYCLTAALTHHTLMLLTVNMMEQLHQNSL